MPATDKKFIQSVIKRLSRLVTALVDIKVEISDLKTKYQNRNPDIAGSNLSVDDRNAMNSLLNDLEELVDVTHAAIISTMQTKAAQHSSHGEDLVDE